MNRWGPDWDSYNDALESASTAEERILIQNQQIEDLTALLKQERVKVRDAKEPNIASAKFLNGIGKYIVPDEGTLQNHYGLIFDRDNELDFWPEQSPAFDGIIAQTFLDPAFNNSNHPRYFDYEPLRDNLSTLRNYLLYVVTNGIDTNDMDQLRTAEQKMEEMGREIGVALQRDSIFKRPGSASMSVMEASEPGAGAAKMYELLIAKQNRSDYMAPLKKVFGYDYSNWALPDTERTPFSAANVQAFSLARFNEPEAEVATIEDTTSAQLTDAAATARREADAVLAQQTAAIQAAASIPATSNGLSSAQQLSVLGSGLVGAALSLVRVNSLAPPVKTESVDLARQILDNMRISLGGTSRDQWLELPSEFALAQNEALNSVVDVYADAYQAALTQDPLLQNDPVIQQSNEAVGKLAYLMKQQAGMKLVDEGQTTEAMAIMAELDNYPESWKQTEGETIETLLAKIQNGLDVSYQTTHGIQQNGLDAVYPPAQPSNPEFQRLVKEGIPEQDLRQVRGMHNEAQAMQLQSPETALRNHAQSVARSTSSSAAATLERGASPNYRAMSQPSSDYLKR
jgi:hypothetical protein